MGRTNSNEGSSYPTYFLKSRVSVFRNNFLRWRTKQATLSAQHTNTYALFATNEANIYSEVIVRAPVVTQLIIKL